MEYILIGLKTEVHWQLACEAAKHAVNREKVKLTYETPEGDETLVVKRRGTQVVVRRLP